MVDITFQHAHTLTDMALLLRGMPTPQRNAYLDLAAHLTVCRLCEGDTIIAQGFAACSELDNFSKEAGRKLALTRALRSLPRADRREIWARYFARSLRERATLVG